MFIKKQTILKIFPRYGQHVRHTMTELLCKFSHRSYIRLNAIFTAEKILNIPPAFVVQVSSWLGSLVFSTASLIVRTVKVYVCSTK